MASLTAIRSTTASSKEGIQVKGTLLVWKISNSKLSATDANLLAAKLRRNINSGRINKMLVDNQDLDGVFNQDVNEVWENLMREIMSTGHLEKIACISPSVVAKMQVDRLSRQAGTFHFNRAFLSEEEAMEFLG